MGAGDRIRPGLAAVHRRLVGAASRVVVFRARSNRRVAAQNAHDGWIRSVAVSPDGKRLATCGLDQVVRVWSAGDGSKQLELAGHAEDVFFVTTKMPHCHSLAVHPNGTRLAVTATNGGSNGNGRQLKDGEYPGNWSPVHIWEMPPG